MPTKKPTKPERPRRPGAGPAVTERPASSSGVIRPASGGSSSNRPDPKGQRPHKTNWRAIRENIGWGLVIGLPVILVILAILWRSTNGFQGNPADQPLPTIAPTPTAGSFVAPPNAPAGAVKNRILYLQAPAVDKPAQLFSADPDGANPVQLTNTPENKSTPVWSPDGRQVAFTANGVGLQMVNFDGTGLHTVAYNGFSPVWSPDGKQLAFLKSEAASDGRGPDNTGLVRFLYVTGVNGKPGDEKQLAYDAAGPSWSPDSKDIAYFSLRNAVMFTIPAAGGTAAQINTGGTAGWFPTFSPDGNSLVFYGGKTPTQFVASLDVGSLTPIPTPTGPAATATATAAPTTAAATVTGTPAPTATTIPTPTPVPASATALYQINRDGSNLKQIAEIESLPAGAKAEGARFATFIANSADTTAPLGLNPGFRVRPIWSADGKQVASLLAGQGREFAGISVVAADGGQAVNIVAGENNLEAGTRLSPVFSEDGSKLYYWFQAPGKDSKRALRVFDFASKKETPVAANGDNTFAGCCGLKK